MKSKLINLSIALGITIIFGVIIVIAYANTKSRFILMLGGEMPAGIIQLLTYFVFIYGLLEVKRFDQWVTNEMNAFKLNILPTKEQFVLSPDEVSEIKLKVLSLQNSNKYLLLDMITKACTKFRSNKSVSEALEIVNTQTDINFRNSDTEQNIIKYFAWTIQSLGLIGTVIGIANSLYFVNDIVNPEGIKKVTHLLSFAFDTTLVAISLSVILLYYFNIVSEKMDKLHSNNQEYIIENLINRIYAK